MAAAFAARWPALDPARLRVTTESITRQLISYIMLPTHPRDHVADQIADRHAHYLQCH